MSINDIAQEKEQLARYIAAMQASLSQKKARGIVEQFCQSWPSYDRTSFWKEVERSNEVDWTAAGMNRFPQYKDKSCSAWLNSERRREKSEKVRRRKSQP